MSRITLILAVSLALTCTALAAAADNQNAPTVSQRADGRLLPDGADVPTAPATRPDDRADRSITAISTKPTTNAPWNIPRSRKAAAPAEMTRLVTGRTDGRTLPDAVDARTAIPPVVIRTNESDTTSFDWLAALIGGLTVGGLTLAIGGLFVFRHGPAPVS